MATLHLPNDPNVDQLRKRAKEFQRAVRRGDLEALAVVAEHHPAGSLAGEAVTSFSLSAAQLTIARLYGFASWPRLKHHLDVVAQYTWRPDMSDAKPDAPAEDKFLRLACLTYSDDTPKRWATAAALLGEHPQIATASVYTAAATSSVDAVRDFIAADPGCVTRTGGPNGWAPLFYLAYARHDPMVAEAAVLETARVLLGACADPNTGYLWHGLPSPFTALTGCFGEGEQGPRDQPPHPHGLVLARLLLDAGADPNDPQTLYNRMFEPGNAHLDLLFEFGLGTGDGGPWKARLCDTTDSPAEMLETQMMWAVAHGFVDRVRLLVEHGVGFTAVLPDRWQMGAHTPVDLAELTGHRDVVDYLVGQSATPPVLSSTDALLAAALHADREAVDRMIAADPKLLSQLRAEHPSAIMRAAVARRHDAIELLVELGFDVNALGRADIAREQPWETALHNAAGEGDLETAELLLRLGARTDILDVRFNSTALGWAEHFEQPELITLLQTRHRP